MLTAELTLRKPLADREEHVNLFTTLAHAQTPACLLRGGLGIAGSVPPACLPEVREADAENAAGLILVVVNVGVLNSSHLFSKWIRIPQNAHTSHRFPRGARASLFAAAPIGDFARGWRVVRTLVGLAASPRRIKRDFDAASI